MAGEFGAVAGIGVSAATGNYLGAAIGAIGLATSIFGGNAAAENAKQAAAVQGQIAGLEGKVNDQRQVAMQLSARRQQMEIFRNMQRARAQGLNAAVNQGANMGSGLQGGQAQATAQGLTNSAGVNQNLEIGNNIFGIQRDITKQKQVLSSIQGQMATNQGIASLGSSITAAGPGIGRLSTLFGGGSNIGTFSNGGNDGEAPSWG